MIDLFGQFSSSRPVPSSNQTFCAGCCRHFSVSVLSITDEDGRPVQAGKLSATVGRPTNVSEDRVPEFAFNGHAYVAYEDLRPGNWDVWLTATALDGTPFEQRLEMTVTN